jgi:hypothetical protein
MNSKLRKLLRHLDSPGEANRNITPGVLTLDPSNKASTKKLSMKSAY